MTTWFCAYTNVKSEERVASDLRRDGFSVFAPVSSKWVKRAHKRVAVTLPLFPRYLFAGLEPGARMADLINNERVQYLLTNDGKWLEVPAYLISAMQAAQTGGQFDEEHGGGWFAGEAVKIMRGPFVGFYGRVKGLTGGQRIDVFIELLKRETILNVGIDDCVAVS